MLGRLKLTALIKMRYLTLVVISSILISHVRLKQLKPGFSLNLVNNHSSFSGIMIPYYGGITNKHNVDFVTNTSLRDSNATNISSRKSKKQEDRWKKENLADYRQELTNEATTEEEPILSEQHGFLTRERNRTEATLVRSREREETREFQRQMLARNEETNLIRSQKTSARSKSAASNRATANKTSLRSPGLAGAVQTDATVSGWLKSTATTMAVAGNGREMQTRLSLELSARGDGDGSTPKISDRQDLVRETSVIKVDGTSSVADSGVAADQQLGKEPLPLNRRAAREVRQAASGEHDVETIRALIGHRLVIPCAVQVQAAGISGEPMMHGNRKPLATSTSRGGQQQQQQQPTKQVGLSITLIVWHKDEQLNSPIFSVDARGASSLREAKQQTSSDSPLKGRAHLEEWRAGPGAQLLTGSGAALVIDEARAQDGGVYTCTLEFNKAPTQTRRIRIMLIEPPRNMIIRHSAIATGSQTPLEPSASESADDSRESTTSQPFDEDSRVSFTCQADPGEPVGQIAWWQLKSVWVMPNADGDGAKKRPANRLISANEPVLAANDDEDDGSGTRLITMSFVSGSPLTRSDTDANSLAVSQHARDYFVAQQSKQSSLVNKHSSLGHAELASLVGNLVLPFGPSAHRTLRLWQRVKSQTVTTLADGKIRSTFELQLSRQTHGQEYICLAQNNDFSPPLNSTTLKINLNLRPTEVKITNKSKLNFKMGQKATVECQVHGSKPEPNVRWFKGIQELEVKPSMSNSRGIISLNNGGSDAQNHHIISELSRDNNNLTKFSYLTLIPQLSDNQQTLTCSAHNSRLTVNSEPLSDSIVMNVQFPAQLTLQFGSNIQQDSIKLNSDVYMDCNIQANPPINELSWLHNDKPLIANATAGYVVSNQSLIIQRIRIEHRGHYQCIGFQNSMGKFYSNKLELKPKFEPVCDYSLTKTRYEIPVNQPTKIECNVIAEPTKDLHFVWKFNQTFGSLLDSKEDLIADTGAHHHLEHISKIETNFTRSYTIFTPESSRRYGQLLCSASNSMGTQSRPCIINVVESELPNPVFACFFDNQTASSVSVHCRSSVDPQQSSVLRHNYLLELHRADESSQGEEEDEITDSAESAKVTASSAVHLKQRDQSQQESMMDESAFPYEKTSGSQHTRGEPLKEYISETPTFHLNNLKPGTGYNLVIYVQNAKGRSAPFFYPANTLPESGESTSASGSVTRSQKSKIQLGGDPNRQRDFSIWDKLTWPPNMSDYLNTDQSMKPLMSIALIVLLCTISAVTLVFFVSRLCRRPHNSVSKLRNGNLIRNKHSINSTRRYESSSEDQVNNKSSELKVTVSPNRLKTLAGSGSDTSRETNTDSTLISLVRPSTSHVESATIESQSRQRGASESIYGGSQKKSAAYGNLSQTGANLTESPMLLSHHHQYATAHHLQFGASSDDQHQQRRVRSQPPGVYPAFKHSTGLHSPDLAPASTPQVSTRSGGSDCTSTAHNELYQVNSEHHKQSTAAEFHDANLGFNQPPVYVIGRTASLLSAMPSHGSSHYTGPTSNQVRLLAETDNDGSGSLWQANGHNQINSPHNSGDQQTNSSGGQGGRCGSVVDIQNSFHRDQLSSAAENELPIPISLLPNSMSIPVSLGDCESAAHLRASHQHKHHLLQHQLSHDFLAEDICLAPNQPASLTLHNNGPYLTLASHQVHSHQHARANSCCQPIAYLDSSLISGYATTSRSRQPLIVTQTNNFGVDRDECNFFETAHSSDLAHHCGNEHHQVPPPSFEAQLQPCNEFMTTSGKTQTVRFQQQTSQDNLVMNDEHQD